MSVEFRQRTPSEYAKIAAKRKWLITLPAIAVATRFGLLLAGLFEVPRLLPIQTSEDAAHYTSLPVLMTLPELLTAEEAQRTPRRRTLLPTTAVAAMFLAIPALALILKLTQVFERFAV